MHRGGDSWSDRRRSVDRLPAQGSQSLCGSVLPKEFREDRPGLPVSSPSFTTATDVLPVERAKLMEKKPSSSSKSDLARIAVFFLCVNSVAVGVAAFTVTFNVAPINAAWVVAGMWTMYVVPPTSLLASIVLFLHRGRFPWAAAWCALGVTTLVLTGYVFLMMAFAYLSF